MSPHIEFLSCTFTQTHTKKNTFEVIRHEKIVFSRQFADMLNPFIGCQQIKAKIQYLSFK